MNILICINTLMMETKEKALTVKTAYFLVNPLHPIIRKHVPHTVLYTFPRLLSTRIC